MTACEMQNQTTFLRTFPHRRSLLRSKKFNRSGHFAIFVFCIHFLHTALPRRASINGTMHSRRGMASMPKISTMFRNTSRGRVSSERGGGRMFDYRALDPRNCKMLPLRYFFSHSWIEYYSGDAIPTKLPNGRAYLSRETCKVKRI